VLNLIDNVGKYVAIPAMLGVLLLLPLYLSQRRDLRRLRGWMEREPGFPPEDIVASEAILDRAEVELETLLGSPAAASAPTEVREPTAVRPPPPGPAGTDPGTGIAPIPAAQRVTAERPALERITMERAALEPHPRWRGFASRITKPRTLALIAVAAVALGVAAVFGYQALINKSDTSGGRPHGAGTPNAPAEVKVAVLNGTADSGLAATVGETLQENGFEEGTLSATRKQYEQTVVMYGGGERKAAERVAHVLGVTPIQRIDRTTRAIAGSADVVVIAGADRTRH
jgi:hypothetical protein